MEKRIGSSAGLFALIAVLLHTFGFSGGDKAAGNKTAKSAVVASTGAVPESGQKILDWQGPWRATQQFFHKDLVTAEGQVCRDYLIGANKPCSRPALLSLFGLEENFNAANLRFLIATIPDPLHTRMSIETDRYLDAIQRASFRSGWELATQWLPWTIKAAAASKATASSRPDTDLERYPGLLVFRRHFETHSNADEILLVLVIAETPTAGINGFQFDAAQRLVTTAESASQPTQVAIAGPTFSGSFLSLARLLETWPGTHRFVVHAGSVSNSEYARKMLIDFESKQQEKSIAPSTLTFHASTLPSVSFEHHFQKLVKKWNLNPNQAAELIEDETGFAYSDVNWDDNARRRVGSAIPIYRYPRDIAQVRNNYNDTAFAAASIQNEVAASPAIEFSLKDTQAGEDIFPMFSTSHTPVSQNAELQQMIRYLKQRSVRVASLSASNVFDTIFLANVLTRYIPDMRIVVRGPDLLFVQEASSGSLSGLMAISAFPLSPDGSKWSYANMADMETFSSGDQIGEFNAVAALLASDRAGSNVLHPYERSFADPPSTFSAWLLELGSRGWLPVDFLPQDNPVMVTASGPMPWFDEREKPGSGLAKAALPPLPEARLGWISLCLVIAVFSLGFCGRLFYLKLRRSLMVWSLLCLSDLDTPERSRAINEIVHHRYLCMICCFTALAFVNGLLFCPMAAAHFRYGGSVNLGLEALVFVAFATTAGTAVYLAFAIPPRVCKGGPLDTCPIGTSLAWDSLLLRPLIILQAAIGLSLWWGCCDAREAGYLLCFRTLALAAPISPIWPLLVSGCGLFALSYFQLRRFTWGDRRQQHLDTEALDGPLCNEFSNLKTDLERNLYRPSTMALVPAIPYSLALAVAAIAILNVMVPASRLQSLEPLGFMQIFVYLQVPLAVFTFITFVRFLRCWSLLKGFLVALNSVVLGRFVERVPEFGSNGPVWMREVKLLSLASSVNSAIALHNLDQTNCLTEKYVAGYTESLRNFLNPVQPGRPTRLVFIDAYRMFRLKASEISNQLGSSVLQVFWANNPLPYVGAFSTATVPIAVVSKAAPQETVIHAPLKMFATATSNFGALNLIAAAASQPAAVAPPSEPGACVTAEAYEYASKYVALQYSIFIGYVLQHLQNLLLCCTICFVFIVVALNCFVFQIPQAVFYSLAAVLVAASAVVLMVLAQVERDPVLSRLSGTQEGELGKDFYLRAITYGALPVLSILSTQFPAISRFISSWVEPAVSKLQ